MNKDKINQYLNLRIRFFEEQLEMSKGLDKENTMKEYYMAREKSAIDTFKEIKAFINSDLSS